MHIDVTVNVPLLVKTLSFICCLVNIISQKLLCVNNMFLLSTGQLGWKVEDDNNRSSSYLSVCAGIPQSSSGMPGQTHTHTHTHTHACTPSLGRNILDLMNSLNSLGSNQNLSHLYYRPNPRPYNALDLSLVLNLN